ncbi:hypothetical protein BDV96DRAFT_667880 [Lophiotrema nucula]|uniref:Uncharacterized protein n=1 Tax=Lophiotrema nucula TaxID=690887 RepID=A0A6A5ZNK3_9PLEO|nr:hypothetical protein BDV96DRAFT_667880 [Lophiotrema nucula]
MVKLAKRYLKVDEEKELKIIEVGRCYRPLATPNHPIITKVDWNALAIDGAKAPDMQVQSPQAQLEKPDSRPLTVGGLFLNTAHFSDGVTLSLGSGRISLDWGLGKIELSNGPEANEEAHEHRYEVRYATARDRLAIGVMRPKKKNILGHALRASSIMLMAVVEQDAAGLSEVCGRVDDEVYKLANGFGFSPNKELCNGLQEILSDEASGIGAWLVEQLLPSPTIDINTLQMPIQGDKVRTEGFTVFWLYFMGYYYEVFLRLVDTSGLQLSIVDGSWGFRSIQLLIDMRHRISSIARAKSGVPRQTLIEMLCALLCSKRLSIENLGSGRDCIGYLGKRTLLCNSILKQCSSPEEIEGFVLLDIDVGVLPSDSRGLIRSGVGHLPEPFDTVERRASRVIESGPPEDCTRHVEADWDVNPEAALLCIRYKGRRLLSLNVSDADIMFCASYMKPVEAPHMVKELEGVPEAIHVGIDELLAGAIPKPLSHPIFVQAHRAPCLGYAFAAVYRNWPKRIASNCLSSAWEGALQLPKLVEGANNATVHPVIVARPNDERKIAYNLVHDDDDVESLRPFASLLKSAIGGDKVKEIEDALRSSVRRYR